MQRWAKDRVPVGTAESSALSSSQSQGSSQPLTHRHPTAPLCPECPGGGSPVGRAALCLTGQVGMAVPGRDVQCR